MGRVYGGKIARINRSLLHVQYYVVLVGDDGGGGEGALDNYINYKK